MFERRLKILLLVLCLATSILAIRALQIQGFQRQHWRDEANAMLTHPEYVETTRGAICDRMGRKLAIDAPCIDASVDYRAIIEEPDPAWLRQQVEKSLRNRLGDNYGRKHHPDDWTQIVADETTHVKAEINDMWATLATAPGQSADSISEIRRNIVARVEMRRMDVSRKNLQRMHAEEVDQPRNWYSKLLHEKPATQPDMDSFSVDIDEQSKPHVILHAIDPEEQAQLARKLDQFPGLSLVPSKHREYPFGRAACHLLGRLSLVSKEDVTNDDSGDNDLEKYWPNDLIGRGGIEGLCENALRGRRGKIEKVAGSDEIVNNIDPVPGRDVKLSVDIELQSDIEEAFAKHREHTDTETQKVEVREDQHGAAVIIDLKTNSILAMVSNPGFDPNTLDVDFPKLARDDLNAPLLNRATMMALEPGSSVKTIVGSGAITDGFMTAQSTIECTGYLVIDGRKIPTAPRCWVASGFTGKIPSVAHHPIPTQDPHPTGFLTVADGLERSCNVVYETIADKMGMQEVTHWFDLFGLGRKVGIGIEERSGLIPDPINPSAHSLERMWTWYAGIGQGRVHATPIQMANVAATLSRDGVWVRPTLVAAADEDSAPSGPDRVDLHVSPEAIKAVRDGMTRVTSTQAGTGTGIRPEAQDVALENDPLDGITIAGKTGSAQTGLLSIPERDDNGNIIKGGKRIWIDLGTQGTAKWYIGVGNDNKHLAHAWFIGYAPAEHPQVAFCVMVEYGGAGGRVAGAIAHDALVACVRHGYLSAGGDASPPEKPVADMRNYH